MLTTHIPQFFKTNQDGYILRNKNLTEFPSNIVQDILIIDLSGNRLTSIPKLNFMRLQKLILRDNLLKFIDLQLPLLYLDLSHNLFVSVPPSICKLVSLTYLNLNSNLIQLIPQELFNLKLYFFGIAKNAFITLPQSIITLIQQLDQFELDWLNYCNISYFMDANIKSKLLVAFQRDCTFTQFYEQLMHTNYEFNLEKIIQNHSLGILRLFFANKLPIPMKSLIFIVSQPLTKEYLKCMDYFIELLNGHEPELLNVLYVLAARTNQHQTLQILSNYQIDLHYPVKFDLICNHKILIIKGQTPYTTLLSNNKNLDSILDAWVDRGFLPKFKYQGENCLHIAVRMTHYEGVKWALKHCSPDKQDSMLKNTPLHILFQKQSSVDIFFLLENCRANPFVINLHNKTPRFYQTQMVQLRFVKLYVKYEKWFQNYHFQNYNSNKLHEMIQLGSRTNARQEIDASALNTTDVIPLRGEQLQEQLLSEILKGIRNQKSLSGVLSNLDQLLENTQDWHGKLLILLLFHLIQCKIKCSWRYKTKSLPQITNQINQLFTLGYKLTRNNVIEQEKLMQLIQNNQRTVLNQLKTQSNPCNNDHLINFSMKLKKNISNLLDPSTNNYFYEQYTLNYIDIVYLEQYTKKLRWDNINILNQYETLQIKPKKKEELFVKESPRENLYEKMKYTQIFNAKFKDYPNARSKSQIEF